jgi:hypothetical protein
MGRRYRAAHATCFCVMFGFATYSERPVTR